LALARQYLKMHSDEPMPLDFLETSKALRHYAGVLSLLSPSHAVPENQQNKNVASPERSNPLRTGARLPVGPQYAMLKFSGLR
jgi:hypothetical protein